MHLLIFFFFKQKTAYEVRISDLSSDVCSSDLKAAAIGPVIRGVEQLGRHDRLVPANDQRLQGPAEDLFALPGGIYIRRVEEVDPAFDGLADDRQTVVLASGPVGHAAETHASEAEARDLRPGRTTAGTFYGRSLSPAGSRTPARARSRSTPSPSRHALRRFAYSIEPPP